MMMVVLLPDRAEQEQEQEQQLSSSLVALE